MSLIKNTKFQILDQQLSDADMYSKIRILTDSIDIMKIYKEMRKIISMPYNEIDDMTRRIIDTKWRLTFIKCVTRAEHKLNHDIHEFKALKCRLLQARRIEQKIASPNTKNRRKFYNTRPKLSPDPKLTFNIWDQCYRSRSIRVGNHTLIPDIRQASTLMSPQPRSDLRSINQL